MDTARPDGKQGASGGHRRKRVLEATRLLLLQRLNRRKSKVVSSKLPEGAAPLKSVLSG